MLHRFAAQIDDPRIDYSKGLRLLKLLFATRQPEHSEWSDQR